MNKRNVIIEILFVFAISLITLFSSFLTCYFVSYNEAKNELKEYGDEIALIFKSPNDEDDIVDSFGNIINIRITILNLIDGSPVMDINPLDNTLSNENRFEELKNNLNSFYTKRSLTTNYETLYYVTSNNDYYVRVGLPISSIVDISLYILVYGSVALVVINFTYGVIKIYFYKRQIKNLISSINNLQNVVSLPSIESNDNGIEIIDDTLHKIKDEFKIKIEELEKEKNQKEFILDSVGEGFIVIDKNKRVVLINKFALNSLNLSKNQVLNKSYLFLLLSNEINSIIEKKDIGEQISLDYKIQGKTYLFLINEIHETNLNFGSSSFITLTFIDVTNIRLNEKMKKEFFQNASHELKTPLTTIIGFEGLITNNLIDGKNEIDNANRTILKEANRMKRVIDDMLTIAQLESEENDLKEYKVINLDQEICSIIDSSSLLIKSKNLQISTKLEKIRFKMDLLDFDRLFRNLLSNAIKYNKDGGTIKVILTKQELKIEDTGIGIDNKDIPRIFERFYMVDKSHSREIGGTGLGLSIVKHIVKKYGFRIEVQSKKNIGTKVIIFIN